MDLVGQNWRGVGLWIGLALVTWLAIYLIRSQHMVMSYRKVAVRVAGVLLVIGVGLSSFTLLIGSMLGHVPREHTAFTSVGGERVALVSHSSYRDFTTTQVTVKPPGCCSRYIAYDYEGDGDDFVGKNAITWVDDHKLVIRYAIDTSGTQVCRPQVGDIQVICDARSAPVFSNGKCTSNCGPIEGVRD